MGTHHRPVNGNTPWTRTWGIASGGGGWASGGGEWASDGWGWGGCTIGTAGKSLLTRGSCFKGLAWSPSW